MEISDTFFTKIYDRAVDALAAGMNMEQFTKMIYEEIKIPFIVVDEGYRLITYAKDGVFADPDWEVILSQGSASNDTILNIYLKEGYLETISRSGGAIDIDWGNSRNYPQTSGPIMVNHQLSGFVSILYLEPEKKELSLRLNKMLCRLYGILIQTASPMTDGTQNPIREIFARRFFDWGQETKELTPSEYKPFLDIRPDYMVAVIEAEREDDARIDHVKGRMRSVYPKLVYLKRDHRLYLFLHGVYEHDLLLYKKQLEELLEDYQLYLGYSEIFHELHCRRVYIQQAEYALHAAQSRRMPARTSEFPQCYMFSVLHENTDEMLPENRIPREIWKLKELDDKNQTNYVESLRVYLFERNDVGKAADRMHLHRNSLKYRLDKISDILDLDLDDSKTALRLQIGTLLFEDCLSREE